VIGVLRSFSCAFPVSIPDCFLTGLQDYRIFPAAQAHMSRICVEGMMMMFLNQELRKAGRMLFEPPGGELFQPQIGADVRRFDRVAQAGWVMGVDDVGNQLRRGAMGVGSLGSYRAAAKAQKGGRAMWGRHSCLPA
jgi:hypothetical protein